MLVALPDPDPVKGWADLAARGHFGFADYKVGHRMIQLAAKFSF